ncbi:MAG: tetratricopeptide repeat protein [Planctomycetota bacterium]
MMRKRLIFGCVIGLLGAGCAVATHTTAKPDPALGPPEALPTPKYPSFRDWGEIETRLKQALVANPSDVQAYAELGRLQKEQRKWTASETSLRRAVELAPSDAGIRRDYAIVLAELGRVDDALSQMELALKLDKSNTETLTSYGRLLRRVGRNADALTAYERAWNGSPPSAEAGHELALWDIQRNQWAAAAGRLQVCLVYEPNSVSIRRTYAKTLSHLQRDYDAIREWEYLVSRGETGSEGYCELAKLYLKGGKRDLAVECLAYARRIDPRTPAVDEILRQLQAGAPVAPRNVEYRSLTPSSSPSR